MNNIDGNYALIYKFEYPQFDRMGKNSYISEKYSL